MQVILYKIDAFKIIFSICHLYCTIVLICIVNMLFLNNHLDSWVFPVIQNRICEQHTIRGVVIVVYVHITLR